MILWLDLETYSAIPIANGVHKYSEDASIILFAYAIDNEPAKVWDVTTGEPIPEELDKALHDDSVIIYAHNSHFDRTITKKFYPCVSDPKRWRDTMILAYSYSLPGSLHDLCELLQLPTDKAKDEDGRRLVLLFTKPRPATSTIRRATSETHPEDWARFVNYARLDVEAMREVYNRLPKWNDTPEMWAEWHLDQEINDRGMNIDVELVKAAVEAVKDVKDSADANIEALTNGEVKTVGQCDALLKHIAKEYNISLPDTQKSTLERRLNDPDIPQPVKDMIALRLDAGMASVKKFEALQKATNSDGRLRGCLQFYGASRTGRWSGRNFQPQNISRGTLKPEQVEQAIQSIKNKTVHFLYDNVNKVISSCVRGAICAPKGKRLVVADLSNIEGRVLAWLAGEEWKLQAFRDFDAGHGVDLYKATYGRTFGIKPEDVDKKQRQIGKVLELAMGYSGGAGAFLNFAKNMNVDLDALADHTLTIMDNQTIADCESTAKWYKDKGIDLGVSDKVLTACEAIKRAWRSSCPKIVKFWSDIDNACLNVLNNVISQATVNHVIVSKTNGYILIKLPSGRYMCYPASRLPNPGERATFCYWGQYQASKNWGYVRTYGGKIVENITQAVARDVLASTMQNIEDAGYKIVLSVHDELITETPDTDDYNNLELSKFMATAPVWAEGLPLAAAGFDSYRYKKD